MSILFFLFILILIIALMLAGGVLSLVFSVLRGIFSIGRKSQNPNNGNTGNPNNYTTSSSGRKRFNKNDVEDAVFEEIN